MRRAAFGEPPRTHPAEPGFVEVPPHARRVDEQHGTDRDKDCDSQEHGVIRRDSAPWDSIVLGRDARVCPVVDTWPPESENPGTTVRRSDGPQPWDDRQQMPPKPPPVRSMPPAFDVPAFLKSAGMAPRTVRFASGVVVFAQGAQANSVFYM